MNGGANPGKREAVVAPAVVEEEDDDIDMII